MFQQAHTIYEHLSYIYLGYFVCLCVTIAERSAILLENQTDQEDETEGLEREGLEMER